MKLTIERQIWDVDSIRIDGSKVIAILKNGTEIATRGANAAILIAAFPKVAEEAKKVLAKK